MEGHFTMVGFVAVLFVYPHEWTRTQIPCSPEAGTDEFNIQVAPIQLRRPRYIY
jgi:hypothetical protein